MMAKSEHHQGCLCPCYSSLPATGPTLPMSLPTAPYLPWGQSRAHLYPLALGQTSSQAPAVHLLAGSPGNTS